MTGTPVALAGVRATRAIVDLDAIAGNVRAVRTALPPSTRIMAVVKADAYGHGAADVTRAALEAGAELLGVATVDEGRSLRARGIDVPTVLLGSIDPAEAALACRLGLEVTVGDNALLSAVQRAAREARRPSPVAVHLKIDTGLRRYGALPEAAVALASAIARDPLLRFAGVCTHFASADEIDEPFTGAQLALFERVVASIRSESESLPPLHAANSAGILRGIGTGYDIVRLGIALYGVPPSDEVSLLSGMRAALRIESRIARVIPIQPGESVGYNRTFRAETPLRGALIPIGYADGYRRTLSGRAWVGLGGRPARVLGRISMDQTVVEIPPGVEARVGDVVQVLADDATCAAPSAADLAQLLDTNAYEVLVGIRRRVPRVFLRRGEPVVVRRGDEQSRPGE